MGTIAEAALMALYRLALTLALLIASPYWIVRMLTSGRYRAGLGGRLGRIPAALRAAVKGHRVVWVHAVSVGEVLAATGLVRELEARLNGPDANSGEEWIIVVSTTTATGKALARERFARDGVGAGGRVFWYPFDFAFAVRAYLRALRPELVVLMESELWPRMLVECRRRGVPVAVVNARVSDRSFGRAVRVRGVWGHVLRRVSMFLAQSEQDAGRLVRMGAVAETVRATGNLKYDVRAPQQSFVGERIRAMAAGRPILVAGSTHRSSKAGALSEEEMVIQAWEGRLRREARVMLVLAPRHPERFAEVESVAMEFRCVRASGFAGDGGEVMSQGPEIVLLDTVGDLAAVYGVASVAFVGGSLVGRGGHNPLEPAQFGVPVVMGPSWENFRDMVGRMRAADAIRLVDGGDLEAELFRLFTSSEEARALGERGRRVYEEQQGATGRTMDALLELLKAGGTR